MPYSILILVFAIVLSCGCASADKRVELASVSGLTITGINIKQSDGTMKNEILFENHSSNSLHVDCDVVLGDSYSPRRCIQKVSMNLYPHSLDETVLQLEKPSNQEIDLYKHFFGNR